MGKEIHHVRSSSPAAAPLSAARPRPSGPSPPCSDCRLEMLPAVDGLDDVGGYGSVPFDLNSAATDLSRTCAAQADGKILLAGSATTNDSEQGQIAIARVQTDGLLDPAFDSGRAAGDRSFGHRYSGDAGSGLRHDGRRAGSHPGRRFDGADFDRGEHRFRDPNPRRTAGSIRPLPSTASTSSSPWTPG